MDCDTIESKLKKYPPFVYANKQCFFNYNQCAGTGIPKYCEIIKPFILGQYGVSLLSDGFVRFGDENIQTYLKHIGVKGTLDAHTSTDGSDNNFGKTNKRKKYWFWVIMFIIIIFLVFIGYIFYYLIKKQNII